MSRFSKRIEELVKAAGTAIGRPDEGIRHLARRGKVSGDTIRRWLRPDNPGTGHKVLLFGAALGLEEEEIRGIADLREDWLAKFRTRAWDEERGPDKTADFVSTLTEDQKQKLRDLLKAS